MKSLSDLVWEFLISKEIDTVFYVSGGGCIFLLDALGRSGINAIPMQHEQSAAIAAEGWSRITGKVGVCLVTSGPGGTNALTGTLCSYLDSIPVMYISGNVNKELTVNYAGLTSDFDKNLRQLGDQEFNIVDTVKTMTKLSKQLTEPNDIFSTLNLMYDTAIEGRPGPVWIDIPLNIQSHKFNVSKIPININTNDINTNSIDDSVINDIINKLNNSKRPLVIAGNGVRLSNSVDKFRNFIYKNNIPVITAVNGNDVINSDYKYYCGRFGTHANISANVLLQKSDFILVLGSRLYVRQTGYNFNDFGKDAYIVHVDIDNDELNKHTLSNVTNLKINANVNEFIDKIDIDGINDTNINWLKECLDITTNSPKVLDRHRNMTDYISVYNFIECLSNRLPLNYDVVTSDGSANVVTMQVLQLKGNQRLFTNTGAAPMGYGLPAAIGASFSGKNILCIEGDGSIHLNIQDLQTVKHYNLPLKIIIINNDGYLSIKVTQKTFFNGRLNGSNSNSGLSLPNYEKISYAYDIPYYSIKFGNDINKTLDNFLSLDGPAILEVFTNPDEVHEPKVTATINADGTFRPARLQDIKWSV